MKKVIAAYIDRILEFDNQEETAAYLKNLRSRKTEFRIIDRVEVPPDKYRIRI